MEIELHALVRLQRSIAMLRAGHPSALDREDALAVLDALIGLLRAEEESAEALAEAKQALIESTNS